MTIDDQIACALREIRMRERVYPGWIAKGRMTADKAHHELEAMRAVLATLQKVKADAGRPDPLSLALNTGDGVYRP